MKIYLCSVVLTLAVSGMVWAADPEMCLDCHEPAEDWEGMNAEEILAEAKDPGIKRHADNREISDDDLTLMISKLLEK
jgi:hypothetical protein